MEKFYLSRIDDINLNKRIKLVEVTYSRKAPTFGVVYVSSVTNQIHLKALKLTENNDTHIIDLKRSRRLTENLLLVDYDTCESLSLDEEEKFQCVALTNGETLLYRCQLMKDGAFESLRLDYNLKDGPFLWCRVKCGNPYSYIHLLSHKCYLLMRYSSHINSLKIINRYSLNDSLASNHLTFTGLHLFPLNLEYVFLELNNKSFMIINGKRGYSLINLDLEAEQLGLMQSHFIFPSDSSSDTLLLSYTQELLIAHSIILNQETHNLEDPDGLLLPSQNSLEVEKCWTIDFRTIEGLKMIDEDEIDEQGSIYLCPLWSSSQISTINRKPKYLVVVKSCNLLVYSFETMLNSSSEFVYDRFFMEGRQLGATNQPVVAIDQKVKPTLVQNFKLVGSKVTDALWNTINLTTGSKVGLVDMQHFQQVGHLVAITSHGHLLSFRFDSDEIPAKKDNLYQQQIANSIRGSSSLLLNTIETLKNSNKNLKEDISKETIRMLDGSHNQYEKPVSATLTNRSDIGAMYSLNISISDNIQVNQILVTSSTNSSFMKPSLGGSFLEYINIDNNYRIDERGLLLADADPESSLLQQNDAENILSYVSMDVQANMKNISICLPVFMMDGRPGRIKIYFMVDHHAKDGLSPRYFDSIRGTLSEFNEQSQVISQCGAFLLTIDVKILQSYQSADMPTSNSNVWDTLRVTGSFSIAQMLSWLNKCFKLTTTGSPNELDNWLFSRFTYCFIQIKLQSGYLEVSSDDMFAKELIRKRILEEATGYSIKLEIKANKIFTEHGLNHLLRLQYNNLQTVSKILNHSKKELNPLENNRVDLVLELLTNEMSLNKSKVDFEKPSDEEIIETLREDIEKQIKSLTDSKLNESLCEGDGEDTSAKTFKSLICGYILDCLADFDKFQGLKVDEKRLVSMESKLLKIFLQAAALNVDSFVTHVNQAWKSSVPQEPETGVS